MYCSLHQTSWPLGNQLTCPVVNVYSANFSVRSITYLEKKIGLIIINKIITFAVVLVLICKRYYLSELWKFYQWMHIDDFTKNSIENWFEFWVHIIHGTSFFSAFYTQLWGCVLYKAAYYTQTCTCSTYLFNVLLFLLLVIAASLWERQQCVISNWSFQ